MRSFLLFLSQVWSNKDTIGGREAQKGRDICVLIADSHEGGHGNINK